MIFLGIDPGLSGSLAILNGDTITLWDTPTMITKGTKRDYVVLEMAGLLSLYRVPAFATLEVVSTRQGQSAQSGLTTGRGGGLWEGILAAYEIPFQRALPAVWKREFGLIGCDKGASRLRAQELFPQVREQLKRVKDDGRADALLLAEYGRRRRQGMAGEKETGR